jgi:hypothetical protein
MRSILLSLLLCFFLTPLCSANSIYVSKLGSNADGSSWATAFNTIQVALDAIPDDTGDHQIIIRPDTYFEAMLYPAQKGAKGAYNKLVGDVHGDLGSGTTGYVVIDSGDPEQQGFKSYDWWGPMRSNKKGWSSEHTDATFSAIGWDRWHLKDLYVTGGDAGIFFDTTNKVEPFSVLVEDCVSIGRAFGGGLGNCLSRHDEPIVFRNCHLWALDEWGDTAAAYVRIENEKMPELPDVLFVDCTMVSPQCALKSSNYGFHTYSHISLNRCRLIVLNFSQPQGTPSNGIIQSVQEGKLMHVDINDCTLMGYKLFGVLVDKETVSDISYTTSGDVKAYLQFQQELPEGILRLPDWPVDVFQNLLPPNPRKPFPFKNKQLIKKDLCEISPFIWNGRLCHMEAIRPGSGGSVSDYYMLFKDAETGEELGRCATGYGLASLLVHDNVIYVFASRWENNTWNDVTMFKSQDFKKWDKKLVVKGENEGLFNSSVCKGDKDFVMAYESNDRQYPAFTTKFARSSDLENWTKIPQATFGTNRYTACPCIRYVDGWYYVMYLESRNPRWQFETYITRSQDLKNWQLSAANPVLRAEDLDEGINASDPDIIQFDGKTWLYYAVGDQRTWMNAKRIMFDGGLKEFYKSWYTSPGVPDCGVVSR